jgi:WD40 repeat protein
MLLKRHGDNSVQLFDAETAQPLASSLAHDGVVTSDSFCADGRLLLLTFGHEVRIWDSNAKHSLRAIKLPAKVEFAKLTPDGRWIITGCQPSNGTWEWCVWQSATAHLAFPVIKLRANYCIPVICDDGRRPILGIVWSIFSPSELNESGYPRRFGGIGRQSAQLWDIETGQAISKELDLRPYWMNPPVDNKPVKPWPTARFSSDGSHVLRVDTLALSNRVNLWTLDNSRRLAPIHHSPVFFSGVLAGRGDGAALSPDGQLVATACNGTVRVWQVSSSTPTTSLPQDPLHAYQAVKFSPEGLYVLPTAGDGWNQVSWNPGPVDLLWPPAQLCNSVSGKRHGPPLHHGGYYVGASQFSQGGDRLLTLSPQEARLWDLTSLSNSDERQRWGELEEKKLLAVSCDARRAIVADTRKMEVLDVQSRKPISTLALVPEKISEAFLSDDCNKVITKDNEEAVRVWDADTGKPVSSLLKYEKSSAEMRKADSTENTSNFVQEIRASADKRHKAEA